MGLKWNGDKKSHRLNNARIDIIDTQIVPLTTEENHKKSLLFYF